MIKPGFEFSELRIKNTCETRKSRKSQEDDTQKRQVGECSWSVKEKSLDSHSYLGGEDSIDMTVWSTKAGFREDISDFQWAEKQKTITRKNLKFYATILFASAVLATAFTVADTQVTVSLYEEKRLLKEASYNISWSNSTKIAFEKLKKKIKLYTYIEIALKSIISSLTVATLLALYMYYKNVFHLKIIRKFYPSEMAFFRATQLLKRFFVECVVCSVHVPPFLTSYVGFPPTLQLIVVLRLYLLGRYLKEKHELMNSPSTRFLASVTKTELTSMFLFKTFFMQYPFQMILLGYILLLFVGGYCVWLLEERYTYLDTIWMLVITMTTVGFGDLTPKTMIGRLAVGLAAIVGIFLMALFISLVNEALMLQRREKRILAYVENQDHTRHRKVTALNAIGMWYKYHTYVNKYLCSRDSTAESLLSKSQQKSKANLTKIVKAKCLEAAMFKSVNEWRRVKESQVSGYFSQEFMIEDMNNILGDLSHKIQYIENQLSTVIDNSESEKCTHLRRREMRSSEDYTGETVTDSFSDLQKGQTFFFHNNVNNVKIHDTKGLKQLNNGLTELFHGNSNGVNRSMVCSNEAQIAFKLLQNQTKIMNASLDDMYCKAKQDIKDLENIISSVLFSFDRQSTTEKCSSPEINV